MKRAGLFALSLVAFAVVGLAASHVFADVDAAEAKGVWKSMEAGKLTLASAIATAEAHSKGKALAAGATWGDDKLGFKVHALVGDKTVDVTVDGTGRATKMEDCKTGMVRIGKDAEQKDAGKSMEAAKQTLATAITAAEAHAKGKALTATATMDGAKLGFAVTCLVGDKLQEVAVDNAGKALGMKEVKELPDVK